MTRASVTAGWDEVLERVGDERDLQFLMPEVWDAVLVAGSLVAAVVEDVCRRMVEPDGRRWVAAALAAFAPSPTLDPAAAPLPKDVV